MNLSVKCSCCACELVCKYKDIYKNGVVAILNTTIPDDTWSGGFWILKDCPHIEVTINCPHMVTKGATVKEVIPNDR